jgi:hypothetical protein
VLDLFGVAYVVDPGGPEVDPVGAAVASVAMDPVSVDTGLAVSAADPSPLSRGAP